MTFIPKYPIIDAKEVASDVVTFCKQLDSLRISYASVITDKQTIDGKIVYGYYVESKSGKNSVFIPKGTLMFVKDKILHIIEDTDVFFELYDKVNKKKLDSKTLTRKRNKEKFVCSLCNYISDTQFKECPNCGCTSDSCNNMQATTKTCLRKKKKEQAMENKNIDLEKAREEALLEETDTKEVTAVYGDAVSSEEKVAKNNNK